MDYYGLSPRSVEESEPELRKGRPGSSVLPNIDAVTVLLAPQHWSSAWVHLKGRLKTPPSGGTQYSSTHHPSLF